MSGMMFERIGNATSEYARLDALDRLGSSDNTYVIWKPGDQLYEVRWKKIPKHPQKKVNVCSKSGRMIRTNCGKMTDASLDVHLKYLLELQFGTNIK